MKKLLLVGVAIAAFPFILHSAVNKPGCDYSHLAAVDHVRRQYTKEWLDAPPLDFSKKARIEVSIKDLGKQEIEAATIYLKNGCTDNVEPVREILELLKKDDFYE